MVALMREGFSLSACGASALSDFEFGTDTAARLAGRVGAALAALPEQARMVLELSFGMGEERLSHAQIAAELGISPDEVASVSQGALRDLYRLV